jgi:hypothetical protein
MGSSSRENEVPRTRRREAGSSRGRVAMVGGRRRRRRFLKFTLFRMGGGNWAGATDVRSAGPRGQAGPAERLRLSGERGSGRLKKKVGRGWAGWPLGRLGQKGGSIWVRFQVGFVQ